ncbi:MAG: hypothetical protein KAT46_06095 [Deltaproteobacteria bacterium]|nr:hypothetical protein [Deltaproteobacteria bacterium]
MWDGLLNYARKHHLSVDHEEKGYGKLFLSGTERSRVMDCGKYELSGFEISLSTIYVEYAISIREYSGAGTSVRVNLEGTGHWQATTDTIFGGKKRLDEDELTERGINPSECTSNGSLEKFLFSKLTISVANNRDFERQAKDSSNATDSSSRISSSINKAIREGKIIAGMNIDQVDSSWGRPLKVKQDTGEHGDEQWIYTDREVYFKKGAVLSWNWY